MRCHHQRKMTIITNILTPHIFSVFTYILFKNKNFGSEIENSFLKIYTVA